MRDGRFDPLAVFTQREPLVDAIAAHREFDRGESGLVEVKLEP